MDFKQLGVKDEIVNALKELDITTPTKIQEEAIPLVLENKDIIAASATGSGKTLAFSAGIISQMDTSKDAGIQTLVLVPTRELAIQVLDSMKKFSSKLGVKATSIYGGVAINPQMQALKRAHIVVATPGRALDHIERGTIDLSLIRFLVLDEADRMLDMGFLDDVKRIMAKCSDEKQTLLFSATMPHEIVQLSKQFMNDPAKITLEAHVDPKKLSQVYYDISGNMKFSLLAHLIEQEEGGLVMVFCNSRRSVDMVADGLKELGIDSLGLHGGLSQNRREHIIHRFNKKSRFVLVCTDVAARGLDIPGVSHVYNYDIPADSKQYVHRIGRTARAGTSGQVINILAQRDYQNFSRVQRENDLNVPKAERPYIKRVEVKSMSRPSGGGGNRGGFGGGNRSGGGHGGGRGRGQGQGSGGFGGNRSGGPQQKFRRGSGGSRGPRRNNSGGGAPRGPRRRTEHSE